jgi:hypothetical protein
MGRMDEAIEFQKSALAGRRKQFGYFHALVASSLYNLGITYVGMNELESALEVFAQADTICSHNLGEGHPWTMGVRSEIQNLQQRIQSSVGSVLDQ